MELVWYHVSPFSPPGNINVNVDRKNEQEIFSYGQTDEKDRFQAVTSLYGRDTCGKLMTLFYVTVSITGIK